jgi:uncharacterized membrane protein
MDLIVITASILVLDSIYLSTTKNYFSSLVKKIQKTNMNIRMHSAVGVYMLLVIGLYQFIISKRRPPREAFLLGFVIYGVFELTNYALFDNWSILPVMFDTLWGGVLLYITAYATYTITNAKYIQ